MHAALRRQTLADLLRRTARRFPDKTAIVCGDTTWSYAEFDAICDRLAAGLAGRGVAKGARVAILSRNSHAFAALRFALARLGAVLVPINFMLKPEETAFILRHAGAEILATDSGLADLARAAAALDTKVRQMIWLPSEETTAPVPGMIAFDELLSNAALPEVELAGGDVAQIVYTSGTESLPKGAMLSHDAVIWQYVSCVADAAIAADDLALHALPLYHCAQLDVFLGPALYVGSTNVITAKPLPDNLLPLIERHRVTSFFAPPTVWIALLRSPLFDTTDLSSLQKGYYGASIMPIEVMREMAKRMPQVRLWNLYGQTEIAPLATMLGPEDQLRKPGSWMPPSQGHSHVASRDVEEAIYKLPEVSEVAVVGVPHPRWVEAVLAVVVVKGGHSLSQDAVLAHCAEHLAGFKVPKAVVFAETLPKNPSGKLLKRELRHEHAGLFAAA